jgi:hypothetical protein
MVCNTVPRHIWMHEVIQSAKCTVEDAEPFRERLNRWHSAGESIDQAAHDLKFMVRQSKVEMRDDGMAAIRRAIQQGGKPR